MTADSTSNEEIKTTEEFEVALGQTILSALQNDVDLQGAWEYRIEGETPDMEVMIVELAA